MTAWRASGSAGLSHRRRVPTGHCPVRGHQFLDVRGSSVRPPGRVHHRLTDRRRRQTLKSLLLSHSDRAKLSHTERMACGGCAGLLAQSASYPLEVIRRRMQARRARSSTVVVADCAPPHVGRRDVRTAGRIVEGAAVFDSRHRVARPAYLRDGGVHRRPLQGPQPELDQGPDCRRHQLHLLRCGPGAPPGAIHYYSALICPPRFVRPFRVSCQTERWW